MKFLKNLFGKTKTPVTVTHNDPKVTTPYTPDFDALYDVAQIAHIFEWVYNPDVEIATKCARTIHRLLTSQTHFKHKSIYHSLRDIYLKKEAVGKFNEFEETLKLSLLAVASMNSSGYVREEALDGLAKKSNQFTFQFILFRLGDWIPVIKSKAEKAIRETIQTTEPNFLIKNHKLIDWLLKVKKHDLSTIHRDITQRIFSDSNIPVITNSLSTYSDGDRLFVLKNLVKIKKLKETVFEELSSDKNYLVRLLAIKNIDFTGKPALTKRILQDKNQKIRQYALSKIPKNQANEFQAELHQLLFDSSSGIRAAARESLGNVTKDYHQAYQENIVRKPSVGCIIGLAEVGSTNDISTIEKFLTSRSARFRAASLFAISLLDYPHAKKKAFDVLHNNSNTVKKACCIIILKDLSTEDVEKLRAAYDLGSTETKRFVLRTLSKYGGWSVAGDFLKGALEADKELREASYVLLSTWYGYSARLATEQPNEDKRYVMNIYNAGQFNKISLPSHIKRIVVEIPFIFGGVS